MTPRAGPLRVLIVDDEPAIVRFLRASLQSQGYIVSTAGDARTALDMVRGGAADLIVLDLGLPDMDGLDVVKQVRDSGGTLPIIILSSRDNESAKVTALDLGADDYVTKPFGIDELLARIRMAERHRLQQEGEKPVFHAGDLCIDLVRRIVTARGNEVKLSPREFDVLRLMVAHPGKVLTHRFMLEEIWGGGAISARLHSRFAPKDRGGSRAAYAYSHRNRRWLSAARTGPMNVLERSAPQLPENARSAKNPCEDTAMDLADLIEPGPVVYASRASNKEQLLQDVASRAVTLLNLDAQTICNALQAREELGSTGLGDGFALPHARIEGLDRLFGMFTRLNRPVHFDAIDGKPVDLVFLLLIPPAAGSEHLAALASISRHRRDKEFAARLRGASSVAALCSLLCDPQHS
jgi:two-component system KDP operon response regulator KdpE